MSAINAAEILHMLVSIGDPSSAGQRVAARLDDADSGTGTHALKPVLKRALHRYARVVEAFEQFVALALETEGLVVSGALKFPVKVRTTKAAYEEWQTHGFEVDLVGARSDRLVLATVKSFFGSRGVVAEHVRGDSENKVWNAKYAVINNPPIRDAVVAGAAARFGYAIEQVELGLYVGKFAGAGHESAVRAWCANQTVGAGPVAVVGASEVVNVVRTVASSKTYRDSAVLASLKVLDAAGVLQPMVGPAANALPSPQAGRPPRDHGS